MSDDDDGAQMMAIPMGQFRMQQQPRKPIPVQPMLAQAMDLTSAFAAATNGHPIVPGCLYQERQGCGIFSDDKPENRIVIIVWRMLSQDNELDFYLMRKITAQTRGCVPDCLICRKHDGDLLIMPYESWRLEPYTGPKEQDHE